MKYSLSVVLLWAYLVLALIASIEGFLNPHILPNGGNRFLSYGIGSGRSYLLHPLPMGALNEPPLELCEENAELVIEEVKRELGTIFGYDPTSKEVGITGEIMLVEVEGPSLRVALKGRFWHATDTVMLRVESFVRQRIPEVIEVTLDTERSEIVDDNRLNTEPGGKRLF